MIGDRHCFSGIV